MTDTLLIIGTPNGHACIVDVGEYVAKAKRIAEDICCSSFTGIGYYRMSFIQ
eukprot:gnl/Chilomastix_caulleri/2043.p2 GENE.gnl/Chilomastix_caulleri/2043~~gnl/Chilomastix_caulleri/2043.p2  ORF type:complete len:52 (+),score=12.27 gnl/Chilomastix_caulleri/2043:265-420(+)